MSVLGVSLANDVDAPQQHLPARYEHLPMWSDLPLYPIVRQGRPVAVLKEALTEAEEIEMASYLQDVARKISEWADADLEEVARLPRIMGDG